MWRLARRTWGALALALVLIGCSAAVAPTVSPSPTPLARTQPFKVVGYVTPAANIDEIDFSLLTHINYSFLIPRANGTTRPFGAPNHLRKVVAQAQKHDVKVLIAVGGWGWDKEFETLAADPAIRAKLAKRVAEFCANYQLDGIDIDWEYPNAGASAAHFAALAIALRSALPAGALVTAAVLADATDAVGISTDAVGHLDFINLMAYDGPRTNHSSYAMAERSIATWLARGIHPDKLVLGVPFYARPGGASYRTLLANDAATASGDRILFKGVEQNYNGPATIRRKTELALQLAGGIMIWELSKDARGSDSLLRVIGETVTAP
jgi:chitinase|uniref:glycosyl hydrolase family 18 protein n=1 Tax=Candidatus Limnocylindrus sp. TaxID=2802978 RepID=UPI0040490476